MNFIPLWHGSALNIFVRTNWHISTHLGSYQDKCLKMLGLQAFCLEFFAGGKTLLWVFKTACYNRSRIPPCGQQTT